MPYWRGQMLGCRPHSPSPPWPVRQTRLPAPRSLASARGTDRTTAPRIDQDRLRAVENITGEMRLAEGSVPGVFRDHTMLLASLGVHGCGVMASEDVSRGHQRLSPIDALAPEHLTSHDIFLASRGTLAARRQQTPSRAEKKPLFVSEERLAASTIGGRWSHAPLEVTARV